MEHDADDRSGISVSGAGDVNGDGLADFIVGAWLADPGGESAAGESYVVFSPVIPGDLDGDGTVGIIDLLLLLGAWGPCPEPCPPFCTGDLDGDCAAEIAAVAAWNPVGMLLSTGSYWGSGSDNRLITGAQFQPDVVILQGNESLPAVCRTSTMVGDATKRLDGSVALEADIIQSLDTDGFTVGTNDHGTATYSGSPTSVWPAAARWMRIWCGRPVSIRTSHKKDVSRRSTTSTWVQAARPVSETAWILPSNSCGTGPIGSRTSNRSRAGLPEANAR